MNERIQKLLDRADLEAPGGQWKVYFAKLVAEECAEVCSKIGYANIRDGDKAFGYGANFCAYRIKQHLGVEE